jgi:hypothetical protein
VWRFISRSRPCCTSHGHTVLELARTVKRGGRGGRGAFHTAGTGVNNCSVTKLLATAAGGSSAIKGTPSDFNAARRTETKLHAVFAS